MRSNDSSPKTTFNLAESIKLWKSYENRKIEEKLWRIIGEDKTLPTIYKAIFDHL